MNTLRNALESKKQESIQQILSQIPKNVFIDSYRKYCPFIDDSTTVRQIQKLCYLHSLAMQLAAIISADMQRIIIHQQLRKDTITHPTQPLNTKNFREYDYPAKNQPNMKVSQKECGQSSTEAGKKRLEYQGQFNSNNQYIQKKGKQRGISQCDSKSIKNMLDRQPTQVSRIFQQYEYDRQNKPTERSHDKKLGTKKDKPFQKAFARNQSKKTKAFGNSDGNSDYIQFLENPKLPVTSRQLFLQKERTKILKNQQKPRVQKARNDSLQEGFQKIQFYQQLDTGQELNQSISQKYSDYNFNIKKSNINVLKEKSRSKNQQKCYRCQKNMQITQKQFKKNEGLCEDCRCESNQIISSRMNMNFSQNFGF